MVHYRLRFLIPTFGQSYDLVPRVSLPSGWPCCLVYLEKRSQQRPGPGEFERGEKSTHLQEVCFLRYVGWIIDSFQVFFFLWG